MRAFERIRRLIIRSIVVNMDLLALWVLLTAVQPYVPPTNPLARNDLVPWTMFCLSAVAFVRGRSLGHGPHRMLTRQQSAFGRWCLRIAMVATPIMLMFWYDFGRLIPTWDIAQYWLGISVALTVGVGVALILGNREGRTAWDPPGVPNWLLWGLGAAFILGSTVAVGWLEGMMENIPPDRPLRRSGQDSGLWGGEGTFPYGFPGDVLLLGIGFLAVGLITGRVRNFRQRRASKLKDGSEYRPALFPYLFASLGSAVGLWALYALQGYFRIGIGIDFDEGFIPAAFVVAWASVIWPPRTPIAVTCLLHEVMPAGGGDSQVGETANPFEDTPEGALRLNPLRLRRVRAVHPWLVPVKASRIDFLDDPIRPLWNRREPPLPYHILGNASFESDDLTQQVQWEKITVRVKGNDDVSAVKGNAGTRRMVVLRPYLLPGESRKSQIKTYIWDNTVPDASVQIVDATTETLTLTDGCVIVLSTEGVARAFEVEIGAPVYEANEAVGFRPPQMEDYVKV